MNWVIASSLKRGSGMYLTSQDEIKKEGCYKTLGEGKHFSHSLPRVQKRARKVI